MWRISSNITIAADVPALACYSLMEPVLLETEPSRHERMFYCRRWRKHIYVASKAFFKDGLVWVRNTRLLLPIDRLLKWVVTIILLPAYVFGRIYLVVECFIQLFHLQPGLVFVQPSWSTYFPHLG
jgi:hypothetical protein